MYLLVRARKMLMLLVRRHIVKSISLLDAEVR
jgi:hypothetical protein